MRHLWIGLQAVDLETELLQAQQEGRRLDLVPSEQMATHHLDLETEEGQFQAEQLLDLIQRLPLRADYEYCEPEDAEATLSAAGDSEQPRQVENLNDRLNGAWLGRCCGCLLGKPIEGWRSARIEGFLKATDQWPLSRYISIGAKPELLDQYQVDPSLCFRENIHCMVEDDDLNYTICGLAILEMHGFDFDSCDVADFWLCNLPALRLCTAERVAYRNFLRNIWPPESASTRNPYREWIGAQIRADGWAYACAGDPVMAARLAVRDASISHVKNGVYASMWIAAMVARAFSAQSLEEVIAAGLAVVPPQSRLASRLRKQMMIRQSGGAAEDARKEIHSFWDEARAHDWCHSISNAEVVMASLLHGGGDFAQSVCMAVAMAFDTDCNGATVGSVLGAMHGADALPSTWTKPLNDRLVSGVRGFEEVRISQLAERSEKLANKKK